MLFNKSELSITDYAGDIHQSFKNICDKRRKQLEITKSLGKIYEEIRLMKSSIEYKRSERKFHDVARLNKELKDKEEHATQIESEALNDFDISVDEYDSFYHQVNREMLPLQKEYEEAHSRLMNEINSLAESYRELYKIKKSMAKLESRKQSVDWIKSDENHAPTWHKMLGPGELQTNKADTPFQISGEVRNKLEAVSNEQFKKDNEANNW